MKSIKTYLEHETFGIFASYCECGSNNCNDTHGKWIKNGFETIDELNEWKDNQVSGSHHNNKLCWSIRNNITKTEIIN